MKKKDFTYYHLQFVLEQGSLRGAYVQDKNISARLCAKKAGGLMREGGGGHICGTLWYTNTQAIRANGTILTHGYVLYVAAITH